MVQQRKAQGRAWEEYVYYILAAIWLLQGLYQIAQGIGWVPSVWYAIGGGSFIGIWGAIHAFIGIGLLTEATWAQFIVKILSWLTLGVSVINIPWLLMEKDPLVPALFLAFNMGVAILQLYVIHKVGDA